MHVLMRRTLGWNRSSDRVGERLLMELCRFSDRKALYRARQGLIEKGLIEYEAGLGRGNRSLYGITLAPIGKGGTTDPLSSLEKGGAGVQKRGSPAPARKGKSGRETPNPKTPQGTKGEEPAMRPRGANDVAASNGAHDWRAELEPGVLAEVEHAGSGIA